jgi:hypothetical protein
VVAGATSSTVNEKRYCGFGRTRNCLMHREDEEEEWSNHIDEDNLCADLIPLETSACSSVQPGDEVM